ncbi:MAG TPA: universal stress protein [Myxococcota bacterium]|nr:universal stress protein [Myxococcota bacterium]HRY94517.1 universal stress protein [Myxococcota bacterium]HSA20016.1 universal stress protein [Myxococcota bacterium]
MSERVLVPLDGTKAAEQVLPLLQQMLDCGQVREVILARAEETMAPVIYDYVLSPAQLAQAEEASLREAADYLRAIERRLRFGQAGHRTAVLEGRATEIMPVFATREAVDRVLLGVPEKKGLLGRIHRRLAETLAHAFQVPVSLCSSPACAEQHLSLGTC